MSNEYPGVDATLLIDDGASGYDEIAGVMDITGPGISLRTFEMATRDATSNFVEHIAGLLDAGELTFAIAYDPDDATHKHSGTTGILGLMLARTLIAFKLAMPDTTPTNWTFSAFVTNFQPKMPIEGGMTADLTLRISGAISIA